jgi:CO dehydrogenase maturation factor
VDADPAGGLGAALGFTSDEIKNIKPLADISEFIDTGEEDGALYLPNPEMGAMDGQFSADVDLGAGAGAGAIRYLRMAGIKSGGSGCYCREHSFLQSLVQSMLLNENDTLLLDMGAGIEHLTRGTVRGADILLIICEATRACIDITRVIRTLGAELGIRRIYVAANKIRNEKEELLIRANFQKRELIGLIRMSESVYNRALGVGLHRKAQTVPQQIKLLTSISPDIVGLYQNLKKT